MSEFFSHLSGKRILDVGPSAIHERFYEVLIPWAQSNADIYAKANPFPCVTIDNFLPVDVAERILEEFPPPEFDGYSQPDNTWQKRKLGRVQDKKFSGLSPYVRLALNELNAMGAVEFLEQLTGIKGLIPDPHFRGGALHQILPGGKLAIHADFNQDRARNLKRRLNMLIYLNKDWEPHYGGDLELWNEAMTQCEQRITPIFNRAVIFSTNKTSYHGHPDPLECPPGCTRKSIALYYYTAGQDDEVLEPFHSTLWQCRPGEAHED